MSTESFRIKRIKGETAEMVDDLVVKEIPFTITLGDKELVTLLCSPLDLKDLAAGFLLSSGLINKLSDLGQISIDEQRWNAYIKLSGSQNREKLVFKRLYTSGCGRGTLFYNPLDIAYRSKLNSELAVKVNTVSVLMAEFQKKSELYLKTGGVHSAAIADKEKILVFREDIGRHNAVDKVIGALFSQNQTLNDKILISSGRISSEIIFKLRKCSIPVVISKSAPTNQAVRHARDMNMTLIGFARGQRMNVYVGEQRIEL